MRRCFFPRAFNLNTYWISGDFLCLECVDCNHCDVANEQECDNLTTRLGTVMFGQVNSSSRHIGNEQQLQDNLQDCNARCNSHEKMLITLENVESSSDHTEDGVKEESKC